MTKRRKRTARRKGGGSVYLNGPRWNLRFSINGARRWMKTPWTVDDADGEDKAKEMLAAEMAKAVLGLEQEAAQEAAKESRGPTFEQLVELLRVKYVNEGLRSWERAAYSVARLAEVFAGTQTADIDEAKLDAYVAGRYAAGVSRGTVRLELAALRTMFTLAVAKKKLAAGAVPTFPTVVAGAARSGFFEADDFARVLSHLPDHLRAVATFGYLTGARKQEILGLQWRDVDLSAQVIRLTSTKNGEARTLAYAKLPELAAVIGERDEARKALLRDSGKLVGFVFWHRDGAPVRDFFTAWRGACRAAGVPGRLFHDLRRTAIRNLVRAGVSDKVAMQISGHETRSVFDRYNITNEADIADALGKLSGSGPAGQLGRNSAVNERSESDG